MPPKKKEETKPRPLIGRVGTNLKMGIVGLPNAGFGVNIYETLIIMNYVLENQLFSMFSLNQVYRLKIFLFVLSTHMKVIFIENKHQCI